MSCILFIIYLNVMVLMIKVLGNDSFLGDLHLMVLMDDTVLLGSTREMIIKKFEVLMMFCEQYGMMVNELKTNLLVINGNAKDREDFICKGVTVKHAKSYIYLGSPFTEDGKINSILCMHLKSRMADLNKFKIFCKVNVTMPYIYKKKVLQAAIISSLLYGSESWFDAKLKVLEQMYYSALKALLGVRETTRTDVILLETCMPTVKERIRMRTIAFVKKNVRADKDSTPLAKAFKMCEDKGTSGYRYLKRLLDSPQIVCLQETKQNFERETGTKAVTYKEMNPGLKVHKVYLTDKYIDERKRGVFTKFRVSSHSLKVETGRWSRIERENRLCDCERGVQDETHVVFDCERTETIRAKYGVNRGVYGSIGELMEQHDMDQLVNFVDECMKEF